jgi:alpha-beta hydrolase superfamily lysophospholipase
MIDVGAEARSELTAAARASQAGAAQHVAGDGRLLAVDGVVLHYRSWVPGAQAVSGTLLFSHGIASHGAWFSGTAAFLADNGFAVYALDRRGSGLSGGRRGHVDSYEQALGDLDRMADLISQQQAGVPLFLIGSSWAAKLAVAYAATFQHRLAGLLLHGPGLFPKVDLSLPRKLAVLLLHRTRPSRTIEIPLTPESYTTDPEHLEYIRRDRHRLLRATARFFWETRRLDRARDGCAARLSLPILLQIGDADPIMDAPATCRWVHNLTAPDRTIIVYRGASHTLDFERAPTLESYRADLLDWLKRHTNHVKQIERSQESRA